MEKLGHVVQFDVNVMLNLSNEELSKPLKQQ